MTKKAKIIGSITAVCAVIGITAGAIAWAGRKNPATYTTESPFATVGDHVEGNLQTTFEGADNVAAMTVYRDSIIEAENGWYRPQSRWDSIANKMYPQTYYYDAATGESTILCPKPECTHDTEYCVGGNSRYRGSAQVYYGQQLYGFCEDTSKAPSQEGIDKIKGYYKASGDMVLVRYAPDGTELQRLVSLQDAIPDPIEELTPLENEMIAHRGALWISVKFTRQYGMNEYRETGDPNYPMMDFWTPALFEVGYGLFHYDIASGKITAVIYEAPKENYEPTAPFQLRGMGDYVYFMKSQTDWDDPYNGDRIYRVNIHTGSIEDVAHEAHNHYGLTETTLYFMKQVGYKDSQAQCAVYCMDLATGDSKPFTDDTDIVYLVACCEDYVFIIHKQVWHIEIYDSAGNLLQQIEQPLDEELGETLGELMVFYPAVSGDKLYATRTFSESGTHCTSLSDAIKGIVNWQQIC